MLYEVITAEPREDDPALAPDPRLPEPERRRRVLRRPSGHPPGHLPDARVGDAHRRADSYNFV